MVGLLCLCLSGAIGAPLAGAKSGATAKLTVLDEDVQVSRKASPKKFALARSGAKALKGDTVRTDETGFAEVSYADGSLTRIDSDTTFTLTGVKANEAVQGRLSVGEVWSEVEAATGGETRLEIETPNAVAVVRGTSFAVSCDELEFCTFAVVDGDVDVTSGSITVSVSSGEQVDVDAGGTIAPPVPLVVSGWIEQNQVQDTAEGREPPGGEGGHRGRAATTTPKALAVALKRDYNAFQADRLGAEFEAVECRGSKALKPSEGTTCDGTAGGETLSIRVIVLDKSGSYSWTRQATILSLDKYEASILGGLTGDGTPIVSLDCGGPRFVFLALPGGTIRCEIIDAVGRTGVYTRTADGSGDLIGEPATLS